jgi:hypothetical protein
MTFFTSDIGIELLVGITGSLTGAVGARLDLQKPITKTIVNWTCPSTGYDNTTLYYITSSSAGYFDEPGNWRIQSRVVYGAASSIIVHGDPIYVMVYDPT